MGEPAIMDIPTARRLSVYRAGLKDGKPRVYVKHRQLRDSGFEARRRYRLQHLGPQKWALILDDFGTHTVHGRRTSSGVIPIIDLLNLDFSVGEPFAVYLDNGTVILAQTFSGTVPTTSGHSLQVDGVHLTDEAGNERGSYYFAEFCAGGGGMSMAAIMAGLKPTIAIEIDPEVAAVYHTNIGNHVITGDALEFTPELVKHLAERETPSGRVRVGIAGLPCQPFSQARTDGAPKGADDRRNLFPWLLQIIDHLGFDVVVVENVPGLVGRHKDYFRTGVLMPLQERGYHVTTTSGLPPILKATDYGGASDRKRTWVLASKYGQIPIPRPSHGPGLRPYTAAIDVLQDLLERDAPDPAPLPESVRTLCEQSDTFAAGCDCYISGNNFNKWGSQFRLLTRPAPTQLASQGYRDRIRWRGNLYRVRDEHALRLNGFPDNYRDATMAIIGNAVPPLTMGLAVMRSVVDHLRQVDAAGGPPAPLTSQSRFF